MLPACTAASIVRFGLHCVFFHDLFVDLDSESWFRRYFDVAIVYLDWLPGKSVPPGVFRLVEFEHRGVGGESPMWVGQQREQLNGGGNDNVAAPAMRDTADAR